MSLLLLFTQSIFLGGEEETSETTPGDALILNNAGDYLLLNDSGDKLLLA